MFITNTRNFKNSFIFIFKISFKILRDVLESSTIKTLAIIIPPHFHPLTALKNFTDAKVYYASTRIGVSTAIIILILRFFM